MCGIAGVMYRGSNAFDTGDALIRMLDGCQHRGPDSTGFALYAPEPAGRLKLRFFIDPQGASDQEAAIVAIRQTARLTSAPPLRKRRRPAITIE